MAIAVLSPANSFNPGADLWIIAKLGRSAAAQKLDWHLNFQMTRAQLHKIPDLAPELKKMLGQCRLPETRYHQALPETLMIESSSLLPNRWLVIVGDNLNFQQWVQDIGRIWTQLRRPSLRVFLPTGLTSGEFETFWKQTQSFDDFTVVVD